MWSVTNKAGRWLASLPIYLVATICAFPSAVAGTGTVVQAGPGAARVGQREIKAQVSGHVYRADTGAPFAGAVVTLYPCYVAGVMWFVSVTTGADGSYTVSPRPFCYHATASSPGFIPRGDISQWGIPLNLSPGEKVENIDFHLSVAAVISGSVSDAKSQPVANLGVSAERPQFSPGGKLHLRRVQLVMTDPRGSFRLDALPAGDYLICADAAHATTGAKGPAPGWTYHQGCYPSGSSAEKAQVVHAAAGKETAGIRFQVTADKTYTVLAEAQDPEAGSHHRQYFPRLGPGLSTSVGRGNVTEFPQVFPGTYSLVLVAEESISGKLTTVGGGSRTIQVVDSDVHVTIPIGKLGEVRGRASVQGFGDALLTEIQLTLGSAHSSIDPSGNFCFQQVVPSPNLFALEGPPRKVFLKQVRCLGRDYTIEPLTIQPGEVVSGCDVTLAADTGVVSGSVSEGNKPAPHMVVVLIPQSFALRENRRYTLTATTDAVGHFQIDGVIPGDYFLFAVPPDIDAPYYALDFPDRNQNDAQSVSVKPNETRVVVLDVPRPSRGENPLSHSE
jgi:hypothetical protein